MTIAEDDWPRRVAVLGVGLLGGSVALAIRRARPKTTLVGLARSETKRQQLASSGVLDIVTTSVQEAASDCDVLVVASPVDRIAPMVIEAAAFCPADCLITDVGSTKSRIVDAVQLDSVAAIKFLGAHPIAGSEKSGVTHASETLFDGKVIVLTPNEQADPDRLEQADRFWKLTGGITSQMSPSQHDTHLATVSHVPHLVSALVARMSDSDARRLVGSGWEDITRVAAGDPALWTAICQENRLAISKELKTLADQLDVLRGIIDQQDDPALMSWLAEAKRVKENTE